MDFLNSLWAAIQEVVKHSDMITLIIIAVIGIAAGFLMDSFASLITVTVIALAALGVAGYVRGVAMDGENASAFATQTLHNLEVVQMLTVLAYAVTLAVVIAVVHVVRSLIFR